MTLSRSKLKKIKILHKKHNLNSFKVGEEILVPRDIIFSDASVSTYYDDSTGDTVYYKEIENEENLLKVNEVYTIKKINYSLVNKKINLKEVNTFNTTSVVRKIKEEAELFFNNLATYDRLSIEKVRKLLLYSDPGVGKTTTIIDFCKSQKEASTLIWPTGTISSEDFMDFVQEIPFSEDVKKLIIVAEDIGGNGTEDSNTLKTIDKGLLELLDGINSVFKIPTLFIATTNYPENLMTALVDRPGRFDKIIELYPPKAEERVKIAEFILNKPLQDTDKEFVLGRKCEGLTFAYIKEAVLRSELSNNKTIKECILELLEYRKIMKNKFKEDNSIGVGF